MAAKMVTLSRFCYTLNFTAHKKLICNLSVMFLFTNFLRSVLYNSLMSDKTKMAVKITDTISDFGAGHIYAPCTYTMTMLYGVRRYFK